MLELCLSTEQLKRGHPADEIANTMESDADLTASPGLMEGEVNTASAEYNWETVSGHLLSDVSQDWKIWTGYVKPDIIFEVIPDSRGSRRHDSIPPALLPGCRVSRPFKSDAMDVADSNAVTTGSACIDDESQPPAKKITREESDSPMAMLLSSTPQSSETNSPKPSSLTSLKEQLGTVISIVSFDDKSAPGSARIIKWDDVEETEKVRWGAEGLFDVAHLRVEKGVIKGKYPNPVTNFQTRLVNNDRANGITFGVIIRYHLIPTSEVTATNSGDRKFIGIMEWPEFSAQISISGTIHQNGSWSFTEDKITYGSTNINWAVRFGPISWAKGTTYELSQSFENQNMADPTDDLNML
jgi:hypothetical protein